MTAAAILLAAGRGERLGSDVPKAFVELGGRPLLAHSLDVLRGSPSIEDLVVVAPPGWEDRTREIVGDAAVVTGGATRTRSVSQGIAALADRGGLDAVVCHDAARPLASPQLLAAVLGALGPAEGAVPAVPVGDTLKRVVDGRVSETLSRDGIVAVQTPQAFRWEALRRAHQEAERDGADATDDAALLERIGLEVAVVPGEPRNIKITRPEDLELAAALRSTDG